MSGPCLPPAASFFVPGLPAPGGSKKAFRHAATGKIVVTEDCARSHPWRAVVALYARTFYLCPPMGGALALDVTFTLPRPRGHFGRRGLLPSAPAYPTVKPDTTKLLRSTEDALKGILWVDDSLIVEQVARKVYGDRPGALIVVRRLAP